MIQTEQHFLDSVNALVRNIEGRVELYEGSTLLQIFTSSDHLKNFKIEKIGEEGKFFGFGVTQKLTVKLVDQERAINITENHTLEVAFGAGYDYIYTTPVFYVGNITRDENTNELTIVAFDALDKALRYTTQDLNVKIPYSIKEFVISCADLLDLPVIFPEDESKFLLEYVEGGNFDGSETVRDALNDVAEVTQTIYYIDSNWNLVFKSLKTSNAAVLTIPKDRYFSFKSEGRKVISRIAHVTELGDNVEGVSSTDGVVQYVRENPFWDLRTDVGTLIQQATDGIKGFAINAYSLSWRGNYLLEIGDKVEIVNKDDTTITTYILNDTLTYDGGLKQENHWSYESKEMETATNPATLGEALNRTYARVDKTNNRIDLVASEVAANGSNISTLQINTNSIAASVESIEKVTKEGFEGVNGELATLTKRVDATMTAEDVQLKIQEELDNGVDKVTTSTGFTFNSEGLTIDKSDSEMKTQITEDGMTVYKNNEAVLVADNEGVYAEDLHATTYLIIGNKSRFEDYGNRTGCFWIGG